MGSNTTMIYGTYNFTPVPIITWNKEYTKTGDGTTIGTVHNMILEGTLTPTLTGVGSYITIDEMQARLRSALNVEGLHFEVQCGNTELINTHPRINSLDFTPTTNNWVMTSDYTINLEFDDEPTNTGEDAAIMPPFIQSASENWSLEFVNERAKYGLNLAGGVEDSNPYQLRLTHNVSAVGKRHYTCGVSPPTQSIGFLDKPAWEEARDYVVPLLGYDSSKVTSTGVINIDVDDFAAYNHIRTQEISETDGSFSVSETWLVINPSGSGIAGRATEDFNVSIRTGTDTALTRITVDGSIQGLESRTYGTNPGDFTITEDKYTAALDYYNSMSSKILLRAQQIGNPIAYRTINSQPLASSVAHSPPNGTISYNVEYDDRPCNFVTGAIAENIVINDTNPHDIYASLVILGRARGPILQDIGTISVSQRDANIEVLMQPPGACASIATNINAAPRGQVNNLLCDIQTTLSDAYDQVFKNADTESWDMKTGRYSRNVSWQYTNCSGDVPSTDFCT